MPALIGSRRALLAGAAVAAILPVVQFDGLTASSLPAWLSLTRSTSGFYYNSSGVRASAASNAARFDYNSATLARKGVLLEPARTNSVIGSNIIDSSPWVAVTVNTPAQGQAAPDGTSQAWLVTAASASVGQLYQSVSLAAGSVFSIVAKAGTAPYLYLQSTFSGGASKRQYFNLSNGTVGSVQVVLTGGAGTIVGSITPMVGGRYLCSIYSSGDSTTVNAMGLADADGSPAVTVGRTIILWDAQIEAGAYPTSYINTVAAAATRLADSLAHSTYATYPSIAETESQLNGAISRAIYDPASGISSLTGVWLRSLAVYPLGTPTSYLNTKLTAGTAY